MTMQLKWPWWVAFPLEILAVLGAVLLGWVLQWTWPFLLCLVFVWVGPVWLLRNVTRYARAQRAVPWLEGLALDGQRWRFYEGGQTYTVYDERASEWVYCPFPNEMGNIVFAVRPTGPEGVLQELVGPFGVQDRVSCAVRVAKALYLLAPRQVLTGRLANEAAYYGIQSPQIVPD